LSGLECGVGVVEWSVQSELLRVDLSVECGVELRGGFSSSSFDNGAVLRLFRSSILKVRGWSEPVFDLVTIVCFLPKTNLFHD